jgi:putative hydrolase of the HAD superfamily
MLNKDIAAHIKPLAPIATDLAPRGELKEKIKGVLFDIYGTLFISGSGDISITRKDARLTQELEALINKNSISRSANILIKEFFDAIKTQHEKMKKTGQNIRKWKSIKSG